MKLKVKGIARYPHLLKASAAKGFEDNPKYSVNVFVHKADPIYAQIGGAIKEALANMFPSSPPAHHSYKPCFKDGATDPSLSANPELKDYGMLVASQKASVSRPVFVDTNFQPIMDPEAENKMVGEYIWVSVEIKAWQKGTNYGCSAYLDGVMITNEVGPIPIEALSSKPSAEDIFGGVLDTPVSMSTPIVSAPPLPSALPTYQMTAKAEGRTRDVFKNAGWSDALLIQEGYMLPPQGVTPSFS